MGIQVLLTWQLLIAFALSAGWLVPVHYLPWTAFHHDAWVAGTLLVLCWASFTKYHKSQPWPHVAIFIAILCFIPLIQLFVGQVRLAGTALLSSLYLLGLLLSILMGIRWQTGSQHELADILFTAFGIAACVSTGVQLCQWLGVSDGCLCSLSWVLPHNDGQRIAANLVQPNQTATLLLLGILAFSWAWLRKTMSGYCCSFAACFLIFGVALTDSRTAMLSLLIVLLFTSYWRRMWPSRLAPYVVAILVLFLAAMVMLQGSFSQLLLLDYSSTLLERNKGETRWSLWLMFIQAALQQPWFGYGWNQTSVSQVLAAFNQNSSANSPPLLASSAHNLFIDLIIWLGIPFGLLTSAAVLGWLGRAVKNVHDGEAALLVFGIVILGVHAMFEFPLYYAYFLLPFGLMVGMLEIRLQHRCVLVTSLRFVICLWVVCCVSFIAVARDYFIIEQSYSLLRLDTARIAKKTAYEAPKVLVLTQLRDYIALARLQASPNMSQQSIDWVTDVTQVYPSQYNLLKLATVLALNGQPLEAARWVKTLCNLYGAIECRRGQAEWTRLQNQLPQPAAVQ